MQIDTNANKMGTTPPTKDINNGVHGEMNGGQNGGGVIHKQNGNGVADRLRHCSGESNHSASSRASASGEDYVMIDMVSAAG